MPPGAGYVCVQYNDPQAGVEDGAEGRPQDRNVELLLPDPRTPQR